MKKQQSIVPVHISKRVRDMVNPRMMYFVEDMKVLVRIDFCNECCCCQGHPVYMSLGIHQWAFRKSLFGMLPKYKWKSTEFRILGEENVS